MTGIRIDKFKASATGNNIKKRSHILHFLQRDIRLSTGISDKNKEYFYKQLAILLEARIDVKSALDLLIDQQRGRMKEIIFKTKQDLVKGSSFSTSLKNQQVFTPYEYYSIQIGEETGNLTSIAHDLSIYFQKKVKQKRQLISALIYPAMVIFTSFLAVFFMVNFIVPMFADIFQRSGNDLPFITQVVISFSTFFRTYFLISLICMLFIGIWFYSQRKKERFRKISTQIMLKIPIFGPLIRKIFIARFCNSMTLLTASKVSLINAIELSRQMVGFYPIETSLIKIQEMIMNGMSLNKSLSCFPIYDSKLISLITVGEEVNQLSVFFNKIAQQYNDDIEHQSALLASILEPFIIIFLGILVGLILIAMYLPLFQLGNSFG